MDNSSFLSASSSISRMVEIALSRAFSEYGLGDRNRHVMRADDDLTVEFGGILVDDLARFATCTTYLVSCKADRTASWWGENAKSSGAFFSG